MKRSILIMAACISFIAASLAFISADQPMYKNLKVLKKNTTKNELDSVMHFFAMSLGERCNFCHARNEAANGMDFASDANPNKGVARYMMRMNAKINKKFFKNKDNEEKGMAVAAVTCYTCHHGKAEPAVKAPPMTGNNPGMPPPPANMTPPAAADSSKTPH
jgi:hypothetical protein